jgi:hypothetical protein
MDFSCKIRGVLIVYGHCDSSVGGATTHPTTPCVQLHCVTNVLYMELFSLSPAESPALETEDTTVSRLTGLAQIDVTCQDLI